MDNVIVGIPTYDGQVHSGIIGAMRSASKYKQVFLGTSKLSILTHSFNSLWAGALNLRKQGASHFCMLHADIAPEDFWLDKMLEIFHAKKASVLSAVMPIKSSSGFTSTAIETDNPWRPKRYTMTEIDAMPEPTFTHEKLLINTGLMLVDITQPWVEKICFKFTDYIELKDGKYYAYNVPEDWNFSKDARALGASLWATRSVKAMHHGNAAYPNYGVWGTKETDLIDNSQIKAIW